MFVLEPMKTVIFDRFSFVAVPVVSQRKGMSNWQSETEVTIDSVQKKPPCSACRGGGGFVFPRSVRSPETEQGRPWLSAKTQDLPAAHRPFALCWFRSVPKLPRGHAH